MARQELPAAGSLAASATVAAGDIITAVNGVTFINVEAVQAALLDAGGADVQVKVCSPVSLESAYDVQDVLGKGKQVSKPFTTLASLATLATLAPLTPFLSLYH